MYEQGMVTESHALNMILFESDHDLIGVSDEWVKKVRAMVDRMPKTDEEWSKSFTISLGSYTGPQPTQEEIREHDKPIVEWWRKYFDYEDYKHGPDYL